MRDSCSATDVRQRLPHSITIWTHRITGLSQKLDHKDNQAPVRLWQSVHLTDKARVKSRPNGGCTTGRGTSQAYQRIDPTSQILTMLQIVEIGQTAAKL